MLKKISIGLVDDQALIREGIARLIELNSNFKVLWQAEHGQQALTSIAEQPVDIVISDIRMPVMDGIDFVKALRDSGNQTPVLILTTFDDHQLFIAALKAGVNGFLLKDVTLEKLQSAIESIAEGGFLAEPELLKADALQTMNDKHLTAPVLLEQLSKKEIQILRYIAAGFGNKEIAEAVHLVEGTVKNHISSILEKMACRDRTQAVLKALRWQLLD